MAYTMSMNAHVIIDLGHVAYLPIGSSMLTVQSETRWRMCDIM